MPQLKNPYWERFAQIMAFEGVGTVEAYKRIGRKGKATREGPKLVNRHPEIRRRMEELQQEAAERQLKKLHYDRDQVLEEMWATYERMGKELWTNAAGEMADRPELLDSTKGLRRVVKEDLRGKATVLRELGIEIGMFKRTQIHVQRDDDLSGLNLREALASVRQQLLEASNGSVDLDVGQLLDWIERGEGEAGIEQALGAAIPQDRLLPAEPEADALREHGAPLHGEGPAGG